METPEHEANRLLSEKAEWDAKLTADRAANDGAACRIDLYEIDIRINRLRVLAEAW